MAGKTQAKARRQQLVAEGVAAAAQASSARQARGGREKIYAGILQFDPTCFDALNLLAKLLHVQGRGEEALEVVDKALRVKRGSVDALNTRGAVLSQLDRHEEAPATCARALVIAPRHAPAFVGRGNALQYLGRYPGWRWQATTGRSCWFPPTMPRRTSTPAWFASPWATSLPAGRKYDFRWEVSSASVDPAARCGPAVDRGRAARRQDRHALSRARPRRCHSVHALRSARCPPRRPRVHEHPRESRRHRAAVSRQCDRARWPRRPFRRSTSTALLRLGLPPAFGTELATILSAACASLAPPARIARWTERLPPRRRHRIGLVWAGNPAHNDDRNRSIPLPRLLPLLDVPDIDFVSLQRDLRPGDDTILRESVRRSSISASELAALRRYGGDRQPPRPGRDSRYVGCPSRRRHG